MNSVQRRKAALIREVLQQFPENEEFLQRVAYPFVAEFKRDWEAIASELGIDIDQFTDWLFRREE